MGSQKTLYIIGGILAAAGIGVGIYFIVRSEKDRKSRESITTNPTSEAPPDAPTTEQVGGGTKTNPSGCSDLDYSQKISTQSRNQTISNKRGNKYLLGQSVTTIDGAKLMRRDDNGCNVGSFNALTSLQLGTIWHINPSGTTVVVKQNKNFDYPFYFMSIDELK